MTGRTVLVTGATDGHGRALARALVEAGATVLVHGRDEPRIAAAVDEVRGGAPGGGVEASAAPSQVRAGPPPPTAAARDAAGGAAPAGDRVRSYRADLAS